MNIHNLVPFLTESLLIENILRPPMRSEIEATEKFLALPKLSLDKVKDLAKVYEPKAVLRDAKGMNVQVSNHVAPRGGPAIARGLKMIIERANKGENPYEIHVDFETLHPFIDGNGRTGRAIWAWQMIKKQGEYGALHNLFLREWYYQSLENADVRA